MTETVESRRTRDHALLQESLGLVAPVADDFVAAFYDKLFDDHPHLRLMFPIDMSAQREKLLKAIVALVTHYDQPEQLTPALTAMGRKHVGHGVSLADYASVGAALMDTLRRFGGLSWGVEYDGAWQRAYTFAAGTMMVQSADVYVNADANAESGQFAA